MVGVDSGSLYRRTRNPSRLAWSEGRRPLGAVLHSSTEPGELSQWLCHDDSTINYALDIILLLYYYYYRRRRHHHHNSYYQHYLTPAIGSNLAN